MSDPLDSGSSKRSADGLKRLAAAYEVSAPTLGAIADAIISRTQVIDSNYERGVVMDLVACVIEDEATLTTLEKGGNLPDDVLKRMAEVVASDPPATVPEWDFLQIVLDDVRFVLQSPSTAG